MFTSICIGLIYLGISNYRYYSKIGTRETPLITSKKNNAILLIIAGSTFMILSLMVLLLTLVL